MGEFFCAWYDACMQAVLHTSESRGLTAAGWLVGRHSFSFNQWYDPARVQFGALRVLNDDLITAGQGFPPHQHENMEIVTIPLKGAVAHEDSSGGKGTVSAGEVQIMSAGTGVTHSEFNASATESLELLQIWVLPAQQGLSPRYHEQKFEQVVPNIWQVLVSPDAEAGSLKIFQHAWFARARITPNARVTYKLHGDSQGVYVFVIEGRVEAAGRSLARRDALEVWDVTSVEIAAPADAQVLVIEVPL